MGETGLGWHPPLLALKTCSRVGLIERWPEMEGWPDERPEMEGWPDERPEMEGVA